MSNAAERRTSKIEAAVAGVEDYTRPPPARHCWGGFVRSINRQLPRDEALSQLEIEAMGCPSDLAETFGYRVRLRPDVAGQEVLDFGELRRES